MSTLQSRLPIADIVRDAVSQSTAHGVCRAASATRDPKLRLLWLLSFAGFLALTISTSKTYIHRLRNPGVATELDAEGVDFEFPDLYFCNTLQAAGSFTYLLTSAEVQQVSEPLATARRLFEVALSGANWTAGSLAELRSLLPQAVLQSMPYRLLADLIGQRKEQTFYRNYGIFSAGADPSLDLPVTIETLYHPEHLKCFKVALTDSERSLMRNINKRMRFDIWLDAFYIVLDILNLYSRFRLPVLQSGSTPVYSFDWDLGSPLNSIDRGNGMLLYLMPRGQYPSRFTTNVVSLAPGLAYDISISMSDSQFESSDFPGDCIDEHEPVLFYNPHTGGPEVFNYSEAFCYYAEMAREAADRYNCSPTPHPLPWSFRDLALCLNLTAGGNASSAEKKLSAYLAASRAHRSDSNWSRACSRQLLCRQRKYKVTSSFGKWPNEASLLRTLSNLLPFAVRGRNRSDYRTIHAGIAAMRFLDESDETTGFEDSVHDYFKRALLTVTFRAESSLSSVVTFRLDYGLRLFVADLGGSLGLYLGCSLLTVLELVELLHRVLSAASGNVVRPDSTLGVSQTL